MSTWPADFPAPLREGYQVRPDSAVVRTDMEAGPARQRRRFTSAPTRVMSDFLLEKDQMERFVRFWENDLDHGAAWFTVGLDRGLGFEQVSARFVEPYAAVPLSHRHWRVTGQLEIRAA